VLGRRGDGEDRGVSRVAWIAIAATLVATATLARVRRDERDLGQGGASSLEELRQEPVAFELDVPYADTGNPRHRVDLYLPRDRTGDALPVIVFFHGGGWLQGDKSDGAGRLMPLLRTGHYAGVSAGYRLSSEATWPAQIHDAKAAIRWVRANARRYGLDADRIGVWGRSAGGHLAAMIGVSDDAPELEGDVGPHQGMSSQVAAVASFSGATELLALIGQPSDIDRAQLDAPEARLIGGGLRENPEKAKAASPIAYVSPNDAPVLTVHGTEDRLVPHDQAVRFDAALRNAGVPSHLVGVAGAGHGDFGGAADDRVEAFFARHLHGKSVEVSTETIRPRKR
jgi:acetyl esterase/lipase